MAGDVRSLTVKWLGDASSLVTSTKKASSAVGNAGKEITGAGSKIGGVFGKLGNVLGAFHLPFQSSAKSVTSEMSQLEAAGLATGGAMTAGLGAAGAAAVEFGRESIQAAEDFNKAHDRLAVVVENVGESMKTEGGAIKSTDERMASLGFSATESESALAKLVPVTHDVGKATTLLGLATDVARARNMSLDEATSLLVQVEGGRMRGLQKLGIATKDASGHTITAAEAMVKLNEQFGGAASEYAQTYAGHLAVMKSEFTNLKVAIGNQILPELSNFTGALAEGMTAINDLGDKIHFSVGRAVADVLSLGLNEFARKGLSEIHHTGDDAAKTMKDLAAAQRAYADDLANGTTKTEDGKKHLEALNDAQTKAAVINRGLADAATTAAAATQSNTDKEKEAKKAAADRADAQKKETDAILGTRDAEIGLSNSTLAVSDSLDTYNQKALIAAASGGKNASANRDWERASNDVKSAIDQVAVSAAQAADQQAQLHGKTLDAKGAADAQRVALEKLRGTIAPGNPFRSYLDQLILQLAQADKPHNITIHGSLPVAKFDPTTHVPTSASSFIFGEGGYVPGPIGVPHAAIVHGGEYVTRAQDVARGGPGGGGHNTYNITVNVAAGSDPVTVGKATVDAIRAYERRNGASWRRN